MIRVVAAVSGSEAFDETGILSKAQREDDDLSLIRGWLEARSEAPGFIRDFV